MVNNLRSFERSELERNIKKVSSNIHDDGEVRQNIHDGSFLYILVFRLRNSEKRNEDL